MALGTEHDVDVLSDTLSNHMIVSEKSVAVVLLHNHPSTQTFSLQDIQFFVQHPMIEVMTIVSNQGTVHYMKRDRNYDYAKTFELFRECVDSIDRKSSSMEMYVASLEFLAKCSEAGLYYRSKKGANHMSKTSLNDFVYSFEPLEVFSPDPNYKVDEIELQKSIDKSREMMEVIRKYKDERVKSGASW